MVIVADSPPIASPTSRVRLLLQSIRAAAMDAIAACGRGVDALSKARQADAVHDRELAVAIRMAAIGGQEAQIRGCGCAPRFDSAVRRGSNAQQADACEDTFVERAAALFGLGVNRMRVVAGSADRTMEGGKGGN